MAVLLSRKKLRNNFLDKSKKGVYLLILRLKKNKRISIGNRPKIKFRKGIYIYIGSAFGGFRGRINRHLRKNKKLFWHIDYLLQDAEIKEVWLKQGNHNECQTAREMRNIIKDPVYPFKKFGSSDCQCPSHLFYIPEGTSGLRDLREKLTFKKVLINGNQT